MLLKLFRVPHSYSVDGKQLSPEDKVHSRPCPLKVLGPFRLPFRPQVSPGTHRGEGLRRPMATLKTGLVVTLMSEGSIDVIIDVTIDAGFQAVIGVLVERLCLWRSKCRSS